MSIAPPESTEATEDKDDLEEPEGHIQPGMVLATEWSQDAVVGILGIHFTVNGREQLHEVWRSAPQALHDGRADDEAETAALAEVAERAARVLGALIKAATDPAVAKTIGLADA